jgi:16S rRNA A1518/A1519 N6-dimethyltransferase RsmA/KsgA/DIM1 with predicted DNA glycosylase/AP lyase activity
MRAVVEAAFAHRRKTLPNSIATVGLASRADVNAALVKLSRPGTARAEELAPEEFVVLAEHLR